MLARRHELSNLSKLGDSAHWCRECNKQWGPYDTVDEAEECEAVTESPAPSLESPASVRMRNVDTTGGQTGLKLHFVPADLHLSQQGDGTYLVTMGETVLLMTPNQRAAVRKFNEVRQALEAEFPARELSDEDRKTNFLRDLVDHQVGHKFLP
jgi:hypothetical protein